MGAGIIQRTVDQLGIVRQCIVAQVNYAVLGDHAG
ncbi:Uncharacterised protein [Yersinia pseudotuberculosis]|nr:Uncharacterised protein [Yersinia pseudotuberculosis]CNC44421.1 Uncharacterised protein [Yersinia pseudotuberculosis]CRY62876.1 Uncharacterised protein [Yersinia pseudotuberculosis]